MTSTAVTVPAWEIYENHEEFTLPSLKDFPPKIIQLLKQIRSRVLAKLSTAREKSIEREISRARENFDYGSTIKTWDIPRIIQEFRALHKTMQEWGPRVWYDYRLGLRGEYTVNGYLQHLFEKAESVLGLSKWDKKRFEYALRKQKQHLGIQNIRPCRIHSDDSSVENWGHPEMDFAWMIVKDPGLLHSDVFKKLISDYNKSSTYILDRELISFYCLCLGIEMIQSWNDLKNPFWKNVLLPIVQDIEAQ